MPKHNTAIQKLPTSHALLCLLGQKCAEDKILEPFHQLIHINQKTVVHAPTEKLQDCLVSILMGNTSLYQLNTTLSTETALWHSWGRNDCADQSGIQRTLEACTPGNVAELQKVNATFLASKGQLARHDYAREVLVIDGDLTGLPCSKDYEAATPGYFADCPPGTTGRQLLRFSAAAYNEIIYEEVFPGNTGSSNLTNFRQVLAATFAVLGVDPSLKSRVLLRLDAGFGTAEIVNYLLEEGYQFVVKVFSSSRARVLCREVREWVADPKQAGRASALLGQAPYYEKDLGQKVVQIGVRSQLSPGAVAKTTKKKKAGAALEPEKTSEPYSYHVLLVQRPNLTAALCGEFKNEVVRGQLHFYDKRAGMESASFCGDKQGLGLAKRRKHSLVGQEMLIGLCQLAHNLIVWLRHQLSQEAPAIAEYGIKRWVRDWLGTSGRLTFVAGKIVKVRLPKRHELTRQFNKALKSWASQGGVRLILRQT